MVYLQVQDMRDVLNREWMWFQQVLIDSEIMLQKHKEKFKNSLILSSEEFKKKTQITLQEFNSTGHTFSFLFSPSHTHVFSLPSEKLLKYEACLELMACV